MTRREREQETWKDKTVRHLHSDDEDSDWESDEETASGANNIESDLGDYKSEDISD